MKIFKKFRQYVYLQKSGYFDCKYYLLNNPDVRGQDVDPIKHYVRYGWREGRAPNPLFDVGFYLAENADVRDRGEDPLTHYITFGWHEGRRPHPLFDPVYYLENNPDVAKSGIEPLLHYMRHGREERRNPSARFDVDCYLKKNPDLEAAGIDPFMHYLFYGNQEGRDTCETDAEKAEDSENISMSTNTAGMKKIAYFCERLLTGFGVDLVVHQQAQRLSEEYDVTVYTLNVGPEIKEAAKYKIELLGFPLFSNPIMQDFYAYRYFKKNKGKFKRHDTFVIHTPTFNSWLPALQKMGKTVVYYYGNSPSSSYTGLKRYRKNILDCLENLIYFHYADEILSISKYLTTFLNKKHRTRSKVVHLGGDHISEDYGAISHDQNESIKKLYGMPSDDPLLLNIGRLDYKNNPYKNTRFFFAVEKQLQHKHKLLCIGFPENTIQDEFYEKGIFSIANANKSELAIAIKEAYLYLSPSLWEGFNLPLIEAQTLGVPVVAFDVGAHREVVRDGKTGYLVSTEKSYIQAVNQILNDQTLRDTLSSEARRFAADFTWSKNVSAFKEYL